MTTSNAGSDEDEAIGQSKNSMKDPKARDHPRLGLAPGVEARSSDPKARDRPRLGLAKGVEPRSSHPSRNQEKIVGIKRTMNRTPRKDRRSKPKEETSTDPIHPSELRVGDTPGAFPVGGENDDETSGHERNINSESMPSGEEVVVAEIAPDRYGEIEAAYLQGVHEASEQIRRDGPVAAIAAVVDEGSRKRALLCLGIGIVVLAAVVVAVVVALLPETPSPTVPSNTTVSPSLAPSSEPTSMRQADAVSILGDILVQGEALDWLIDRDTWVPPPDSNETFLMWTQRYALSAIYYSTDTGTGWYDGDNWLSSMSVCEAWYGVECDSEERVVAVRLGKFFHSPHILCVTFIVAKAKSVSSGCTYSKGDNRLVGELPAEIQHLSFLTDLNLGA
jgi:hypothetical protein